MLILFILALVCCATGAAFIEDERKFSRTVIAPTLVVIGGMLMSFVIMKQGMIIKKDKYNIKTEVRTTSVNNKVVSQDTVYIITRK